MPLLRYFFFVGGCLIALLFAANAYLPKSPDVEKAEADLPLIRIQSDRKWPERVVFDTNRPTIVPSRAEAAAPSVATVAGISTQARVRGAFAQLLPTDQGHAQQPDPKPDKKVVQKRKVAKRPAPRDMLAAERSRPHEMLVAQQPQLPQFGLFGIHTW